MLRPENARYARAGFPTKVTESLASATPVICNITSDLGMYIEDMNNGIIVKECSAGAVKEAVERALDLDLADRERMCRNARDTAEEFFDYNEYASKLIELLEQ